MKYYFFLDETGDHGLGYVDPNFPLFLLCGCLFSEDELRRTEGSINSFKMSYFNSTEVILHSREIRKCEGAFQILFDLDLKARFYKDLNQILAAADFTIIGAGIHKEKHVKKYGRAAGDPYSLSLSFVIERVVFCLDGLDRYAKLDLVAEKRGKKEDVALAGHYNSVLDRGTSYLPRERLRNVIEDFRFRGKRENVIGLQIADLCAYPLARHLLFPAEPYVPFEIVQPKIYCDRGGRFRGWGLKLFP